MEDYKPDYTPDESPWKEKRLNPRDAQLRRWGWRIHSRAKGQEPVWEKHGVLRKQSEIKADEKVEKV